MKPVNDAMNNRTSSRFDYQSLVNEIVRDPEVAAFIEEHQLNAEEIRRSISNFSQFISERELYQRGQGSYLSKGYQPILIMNQGYADVSYKETTELIAAERAKEIRNRVHLLNLPNSLRGISLQDVDPDDRWGTIQELTRYLLNYPQDSKGFYLYGDFGIGKTYLLAALANDLARHKEVETTLLHFPTFVLDLKNGFDEKTYHRQLNQVKGVPVLMIDDIGAEVFTPWLRDEVLQIILQHRMQERLPTFFSSNLSFDELQVRMAQGRAGDETWQATRIMERMRFLAKEIHVPGQNRRN
ncbi:primosomal protein DnaI [Streptococcus sp. NLN76]|uniref:primosomal protein DnaI n=1 Tax=Streptococcus sp. NLN76 TaxID=2822800 RepID=UPI0018ABC251|nr:primosomal protein DnaI [Streptococcus sp. NLN76]MBF8970080.1 primosomal protein DnaI [Streptococcus sp. NLN76]